GGFAFNVAATKSATSRILLVIPCAQSRHGDAQKHTTFNNLVYLTRPLLRTDPGVSIYVTCQESE
ncbi:MAG: hypothetical protein ABF312_05970, partial [Candidatus Nanopelagicales bacterium]